MINAVFDEQLGDIEANLTIAKPAMAIQELVELNCIDLIFDGPFFSILEGVIATWGFA